MAGICNFPTPDEPGGTLGGVLAAPHPLSKAFKLIARRRSIAGSMIGGIPETQEMLDFCATYGIVADIARIRVDCALTKSTMSTNGCCQNPSRWDRPAGSQGPSASLASFFRLFTYGASFPKKSATGSGVVACSLHFGFM